MRDESCRALDLAKPKPCHPESPAKDLGLISTQSPTDGNINRRRAGLHLKTVPHRPQDTDHGTRIHPRLPHHSTARLSPV